MNKLSLIAAAAAAALLAMTWSVTVQLNNYASSNSEDNSPPPAWHHRPPLQPIVNTLDTNHDGMANSLAPKEDGAALSYEIFQSYRRHIDQNYQRYTSARQIAFEFHSNVAYLNRLFQRYGHVSLDHYLSRLTLMGALKG